MSAPENNTGSSSKDGHGDPPPLSIELPKIRDLPRKSKPWNDDHLPVDILLLTVEDCEFLACYYYLQNPFKSYHRSLGPVYFGNMGDEEKPLKVALMRSSGPGGSQTVVKNAVTQLRPRAIYSSGFCSGVNHEKTKLGDVVVSSKLATDAYKTPVSRDIANVIRSAADGWEPPLENPEAREVKVHCDGEIFSCPDPLSAERQRTLNPEVVAVEMEGKGIYLAAHDMKMEWVIVKGVSSFVDHSVSTNESWKTFACCMAASLISNMLYDSVIFADWPHYGEEDRSMTSTKRDLPFSSSQDVKRMKLMTSNVTDTSTEEESSHSCSKRELPCSSDHPDAKRSGIAEPFDLKECKRQLQAIYSTTKPFDLKECQRQLQAIYNTTSKVKIIPWDSSSAVHIDEIYTQLSWVKDDRKPSGMTKERLKDYTDIFREDKHYPNPKRTLVYGRPGIGKTVFTQKTTFDWSQQRNEVFRKFDLVLLIKLRDVSSLEDIHAILTASELLAGDGMISVDDLYHYILENQEKVLLILDGYDEYTAGTSSPVVDIWESRLLRDCHVIITTRKLKSDELRRHSHVQFEINGFDSKDQIKKFARKLLKDETDVKEFYKYLLEKDLKGMAEIPLLLLMICLLWKEKDRKGLPKQRAAIYTNFTQTLLDHMIEKEAKAKQFRQTGAYKEELCTLGKLAFDALLRDKLSFPLSELPDGILSTRLIEVGLFHVLNVASLYPEKGVYFIHKSVQEFLAAFYLNELLKEENTTCLFEVDSFKKVIKMIEVLKFAYELSADAACAVLSHLGIVGKKEGLTEYNFTESPGIEDLPDDQKQFLTLISQCFFCCSAEKRRDLYPMFLSYVGGVLVVDSDQLHSVANEHFLKSAVAPGFFFSSSEERSEESYRDLISVVEDLDAVLVCCSGEKRASDFLKKYPFLEVNELHLKKEGTMKLYISHINDKHSTFPTEMLRELISLPESTQKKKPVGDQSNEQDNRTSLCLTENTDTTPDTTKHCLSCVCSVIFSADIKRQEMETLIEVLPFVTSPQEIVITGEGRVTDPGLVETLVSRINFTNRLVTLGLMNVNLTAKPAAVIARSLYQAPNLRNLRLSSNPLCEGVSDLTRHLSCAPHLDILDLHNVKMTKEQVYDLTEALRRRRSKIYLLQSSYHDQKGNPKPEHEWLSQYYWQLWYALDHGLEPGKSSE